jgi:hypothetical protein
MPTDPILYEISGTYGKCDFLSITCVYSDGELL